MLSNTFVTVITAYCFFKSRHSYLIKWTSITNHILQEIKIYETLLIDLSQINLYEIYKVYKYEYYIYK